MGCLFANSIKTVPLNRYGLILIKLRRNILCLHRITALKKGELQKTVLSRDDPLRAEFIAKTYLENPICYNKVRGMLGFTGKYKGIEVSVQGSGMGIPSIGIYSYELFNEYDVDNIIRVGTAGGIADNVNLRDIVIAMGACTNSSYADQYGVPGTYASHQRLMTVKKCGNGC